MIFGSPSDVFPPRELKIVLPENHVPNTVIAATTSAIAVETAIFDRSTRGRDEVAA
jgi:hypothetical protein